MAKYHYSLAYQNFFWFCNQKKKKREKNAGEQTKNAFSDPEKASYVNFHPSVISKMKNKHSQCLPWPKLHGYSHKKYKNIFIIDKIRAKTIISSSIFRHSQEPTPVIRFWFAPTQFLSKCLDIGTKMLRRESSFIWALAPWVSKYHVSIAYP